MASLNPFPDSDHMVETATLPNVELVKANFPDVHLPLADALVIREFHYIEGSGSLGVCLKVLDSMIKKKGLLILLLNRIEYQQEGRYSNIIARMPGYKKIESNRYELVFQKMG
ncbi:MAG: hypothetical protein ACQESG_03950 [Nanobdellota archaeon]